MFANQKNKCKSGKKTKSSGKVVVLRQGTSGVRLNSFGKDGCGY